MMLTQRKYFNIFNDDHLIMVFFKNSIFDSMFNAKTKKKKLKSLKGEENVFLETIVKLIQKAMLKKYI